MHNFNKQQQQQQRPKINIPKIPQQFFLKKGDEVKQQQTQQKPQIHLEALKHVKTVKHIDELYSATFLDDYFR
jgi:hypothetical protein